MKSSTHLVLKGAFGDVGSIVYVIAYTIIDEHLSTLEPNDNWADVDVAQIIGHSLRGLVRLFVLLRHALRKGTVYYKC